MATMMPEIKKEYKNLQKEDIYSILLFVLYKLNTTNEYSSLSELAYVLDEKNFLKLCEYFGGTTITIPTIGQLQELIQGMLLYQYIYVEHISEDEAEKLIRQSNADMKKVKENYTKIKEVLTNYEFSNRPQSMEWLNIKIIGYVKWPIRV